MTSVIVTERGMYDMAEQEYHGDPVPGGSLSCSGAKLILPPGCPARYAWQRKQPPQGGKTAAMEFGSAAHAEVLGTGWPLAVWNGPDWKSGHAQEFAAAARRAGQIPLLAREREQVTAMAAAIAAHPTARLLLTAEEAWAEQSFFWPDDETGVWLRARLDAVRLRGRVIVTDYKTAISADPAEWAKSAGRYRYHWQDPWYREAITKVLGDADPAFLFVAQEKTPPYVTAIYELDFEARMAGAERIRAARRLYARCAETGEWPGVQPAGEVITRLSLPRWSL